MRKLHDKYFKQAKREGHLARSIYKLEELDRRNQLIRRGSRILDLGAAPGSWLEYALEKAGDEGVVCAVDLKPIAKRFKGKVQFFMRDIRDMAPLDFAPYAKRFDLVMSDMAPNTSGIKATDQARSLELCETAFDLAREMLEKGGHFLCKVLEGPDVPAFRERIMPLFSRIRQLKPDASREESTETYILGLGFGLPPKPKKPKPPVEKKKKPKKGKRSRPF